VNSQQAQIQELIQSIDAVLGKASPRLPWVMAGESEQQRQILERTRQYLVSLQQQPTAPAALAGAAPMNALPADPTLGPMGAVAVGTSPGESAQQVLQAVLQEVTYLRTNIMQPMRGEVDDLRQQRDALVNEIKELEAQRQHYALPPQPDSPQQQQALSEFLQSLMGRLQENLTVQVAEMLTHLEARTLPPANDGTPAVASAAEADRLAGYASPLTPPERLAQLQQIQTQSDQLLLKLDTTLRVIFESLQRNIQTYEDSLSQGLDKMHTLGHQGEAIFAALINRLAQQLGREASQYLQSSLEGTDWQALPGASGRPLAGTARSTAASSPLDSLMNELAESEATMLQPPLEAGSASRQRTNLNELNQEIHGLELATPPPDLDELDAGEMTMFQMDERLMATRIQDEDMTIFQINEAAIASSDEAALDDSLLDNSIDDIDSALELLNQISSELETEPEEEAAEPMEVGSPEGIYDELDALYQSLFGTDVSPEEQEPPVDRHVADAEQVAQEPLDIPDWDAIERAEQIEEFESQFFEGLADLSQEAPTPMEADQEDGAELLQEPPLRQESPQVVEQLLFDEVPMADAGEQEDTQLLDIFGTAHQNLPADVITSLEDLISLSDTTVSLDALRSEGDQTDEDIYVPASPDEDLLNEAIVETPRMELQVDEGVLQQLDAELSSLETGEPDLEMEEPISFLSDLSEEPEDISTSLEYVFQEPLEEPDPLAANLEVQEEAWVEEPPAEPEPAAATEDEAGLEDWLLENLLEDEGPSSDEPDLADLDLLVDLPPEADTPLEEISFGLGDRYVRPAPDEVEAEETSDLTDLDMFSADISEADISEAEEDAEISNSEFFTAEFFTAEVFTSEISVTEIDIPAVEDSEADRFELTLVDFEQVTLESLVADEPDPSPEPSAAEAIAVESLERLTASEDDLLESLLEDMPPEAFEEENLPATDDGLLERLLEETEEMSVESLEPALAPVDDATPPTEFSLEEAIAPPPMEDEASPAADATASFVDDLGLLGLDLNLPELADSAPPPPPLILEEGDQLPLDDTPEETVAFPSSEAMLPPDREDLTLEGFQMVMATPPVTAEALLAEWPDSEEPSPAESSDVPPTPIDPVTADFSLTLQPEESPEDTLDSFASALELTAEAPGLDAPEETGSSLDLAAWFEAVEDVPPSIEVEPPGAQLDSLESASAFLEMQGDMQVTEQDAAPPAVENAFTLEGLGDLFELDSDPPADAAPTPPPEEETPEATSAADLGTDFGLAGIDLYETDASQVDSDPSKKKELDNVSAEAVAEVEPPPPEDSLDYTSELILQAIGLETDAGQGENPLPDTEESPEAEEPDLALMELTSDLMEADEADVDPDLAALLQRLQQAPADVDEAADPLSLLREQEEDLESLIFSVSDSLEDNPALFAPPPLATPQRRSPTSPWYLGVDLGTTGISVVLLNRQTATLYPMFWLEIKFPGPVHGSVPPIPEKTYRLPVAVYVAPIQGQEGGTLPEVAIASLSITRQEFRHPTRQPLRDFKPLLRAGIPYYTLNSAHWEPVLQWSDQRTLPLSVLHQALRALLTSLNYTNPQPQEGSDSPVLSCGAIGLPDNTLQDALQDLAGVVVSHPASWSDTYRFNVREAILAARLVDDPAQVYLMEESVATLLSALQNPEHPLSLPDSLPLQPNLLQAAWQGGTLILNGGASVTELALVNLPNRLQTLSHEDFAIRTLPYGGNALDQDIICQLIYPAWVRQAHRTGSPPPISPAGAEATLHCGDDLDWADPWAALGWEHLTLPVVGDPDLVHRQVLHQRLLGASVGLGLLEAARYLKLTLQQQDQGTLILGNLSLTVSRQDLGSRVLLPYIQRLNRELNGLLTQTGIPVLQVNQVLCSGGSASLAAIARWLRQKLPNATIVQDTYAQPNTPQHNHLSACSRVAYGLAAAPLYAPILDQSRHRYSDYFLLMELLRIFPDEPVSLGQLLHMLEQRGIDIQTCQPAIVALLEGHLPVGLVPADWEAAMLTPASQHNPDYQALLAAPLFVREADQTYRPNPQQWQVFRRYLDTLLAASYQKLTEPLGFAVGTLPSS